jgi:phytoene synthase
MLPAEKRWATFVTYGFCRYADNLIDKERQRSSREVLQELDHLARELEIAYRSGESEHPIIKPFILVAKKYEIPIEYPMELLDGVKMDMLYKRYDTFDDLYIFCYRVAGVVGLMMTHILGYRSRKAFEYAEKLGIAMQLTNILRDIKEDKDMGRIYIPQEELNNFNCSDNNVLEERFTAGCKELMVFQIERAKKYYTDAQPGIKLLATDSQFAIQSASKIYRGILHKIESRDYDPFQGRVFVPQRNKIRILASEVVRTKLQVAQEQLVTIFG